MIMWQNGKSVENYDKNLTDKQTLLYKCTTQNMNIIGSLLLIYWLSIKHKSHKGAIETHATEDVIYVTSKMFLLNNLLYYLNIILGIMTNQVKIYLAWVV